MPNEKMKILETYKRTAVFPIDTNERAFTLHFGVSNSTPINVTWQTLATLILASFFLFSLAIHFIFEVNTFAEYSQTFFPMATSFVALCSCAIQVIVKGQMIALIDNIEMVIEERK